MAAGRKNKKKKIAEIGTFNNVFQCPEFNITHLFNANNEAVDFKGKWGEAFFKNDKPIVVELACGKGDYTIALARQDKDKNFIGVDIKGPRIHLGAKTALEEGLANVAFARFKIENILNFFGENEISEIWITFPDPFPKDRHEKHRLTFSSFLEKYKVILKPDGIVNFKTDDLPLFQYSKESVESFKANIFYYKENIYAAPLHINSLEIKTFYEYQHLRNGRTINFMQFGF